MSDAISSSSDGADLLEMLRRDGVIATEQATLKPLTGGVSSEIYLVEDGEEKFVVKRALKQLKVRDDWFADPRRNLHEQAFLRYVGSFLPDAVPAVVQASEEHFYFVMEYLGEGFVNWKQELLAGRCNVAHAQRAAEVLAIIHEHSANDPDVAKSFETTTDFIQLRIEPYLLTTGQRHPRLRGYFEAEAERLAATRLALVHGDYSPKNILIGGDRLVVLDCEVAWYGDPAFDVAFLLNHLLLKALHHAGRDVGLRKLAESSWQTYRRHRAATANLSELESHVVRLLLMLLLARVDGKSPAEYLAEGGKVIVRDFVNRHLPAPPASLAQLFDLWFPPLLNESNR